MMREWVFGIVAASLAGSIALTITPKGGAKSAVRLACGLMMAAVILKPVAQLDIDEIKGYSSQYELDTEQYSQKIEEETERLAKAIIEEETAAYILDKASADGITVRKVTVQAESIDGGWPCPYAVQIDCDGTEEQLEKLAEHIETELGIPRVRQDWS